MKLNLTMNDNDNLYSILLGEEVVYSIPQSDGLYLAERVFDALIRCMSITIQEISEVSHGVVTGSLDQSNDNC